MARNDSKKKLMSIILYENDNVIYDNNVRKWNNVINVNVYCDNETRI